MGWLGWTEQQTLNSDMQSIELAYRGRHEMLCALAGKDVAGAKIETAKPAVLTMTTDLAALMFGRKN